METERKGSIYKITNKINGKCYHGQTIRDPIVRFNEHIHSSTQDDPGCRAIALALRSYGVDNFTFEVVVEGFAFELDFLESEFIEMHNSLAPHGYNLYPGGKNTYRGHTGSARDKISSGQRKHFDGIHDLPRYVMHVPAGEHGEGYAVASPEIDFMQFSSRHLSMDEKYELAIRYLTEDAKRASIRDEYNTLKHERKRQSIMKKVTIDGEDYYLPVHFMWCPTDRYFLIRKRGKNNRQFGDKRISVRENYERALHYYNS
jgi:group I intron endonuclease